MEKRPIIGVLAVAMLAGCSNSRGGVTGDAGATTDTAVISDSGGTPAFMTTVPETTVLGQMSGTQLQTMCTDLDGYRMTLARDAASEPWLCKLDGLVAALGSTTLADAQQFCSNAVNTCMSNPDLHFHGYLCSVTPSSGCMATVAQYTACLNDSIAAAESSFASLPDCASLTTPLLDALRGTTFGGATTPPPSCTTFSAACPDTGGTGDLAYPIFSAYTFTPPA